jgi:cytochrome b561
MSRWRNTGERFGAPAIALHWLMAALLVLLIASGLYMTALPDAGFDTRKIILILYHKQFGMLALALVLVRMAWRAANPLPSLVDTIPQWQQLSARVAHLLFYALMLALPVSGWLMSSAGGFSMSFLGLFELPDLVPPGDWLFHRFIAIHRWLGYGLLALALVHAGAALRHHFVVRDATLSKMLGPG